MIGLFLALALGCAPKAASVAEQHRLEGELRSLAARAHWSGVDGTYRRLLALPGAPLSYDDHWLGAQAAEALGEPAEVYRRLQTAIALNATDARGRLPSRLPMLSPSSSANAVRYTRWRTGPVPERATRTAASEMTAPP